jgi:actin-related protein
MYSDDIFALTIDICHSKSIIGYAGDENPKYFTDSAVGHVMGDAHNSQINQNNDMGLESTHNAKYIFGEHLSANLKNLEVDSLLEKGVCRYLGLFLP